MHTTKCTDGHDVQTNVFEAVDSLPEFQVGHVKTSMTKNINCYFRPGSGTARGEVAYLDSPGFEDTDGHEIDIATSVMLSKVAQRCHSLRFVILVNYVSLLEDRGGAMRAVLKLCRSFVQDFSEKQMSFMFLFTHTDQI